LPVREKFGVKPRVEIGALHPQSLAAFWFVIPFKPGNPVTRMARLDEFLSDRGGRKPFRLLAVPFLGLLLGVMLFAGCSHYRLGTGQTLAFQTLYVAPVENKTLLPQAVALVSTALRDEFLRDGRVTLVDSPQQADATLTLALTDYHRDVATGRPGDTGLARTFTLTLGAVVTLHDNRAGRDLFSRRPVDSGRDAYTDSGQLQSEYQSLPLLAGALAKKISHAALDVW
jgi:hypothetical protein